MYDMPYTSPYIIIYFNVFAKTLGIKTWKCENCNNVSSASGPNFMSLRHSYDINELFRKLVRFWRRHGRHQLLAPVFAVCPPLSSVDSEDGTPSYYIAPPVARPGNASQTNIKTLPHESNNHVVIKSYQHMHIDKRMSKTIRFKLYYKNQYLLKTFFTVTILIYIKLPNYKLRLRYTRMSCSLIYCH